MKITIEINDENVRETFSACLQPQELVEDIPGKLEQTDFINIMCKPLPDGTLRSLASGTIYKPVEPQEQPACKARRFLLVDEHANVVEGVKWENGSVSLDLGVSTRHERWFYDTWDEFKAAHPGSGVQWIDQEVAE